MRNAGGRMNAELAQEDTVWSPNMLIPTIHTGVGDDQPSMGRMTTSGFHLGLKGSEFEADQDATTATTANTMSTPATTRSRTRNDVEAMSGGGGNSSGGGLGVSGVMHHPGTPVAVISGGSGGCGGGGGGCGASGSCVGGGGCTLSDGGMGTTSVSGRGGVPMGVGCLGMHDGLGSVGGVTGGGGGSGMKCKKAADGLSKGHSVILYSRGHEVARGKIISCERNGQCKVKLRTWNGDGLTLTADGKPLREVGPGGEILWLRGDVRRDPHRPMTDGSSSIG
ncbi:hypothetical protein CBR_g915 [Chara braunii]|uniref:Uncharacterized protein n=1 Tax=Chara braunii TaxID=69332 RepID=A0A388KCN5_CHABU|nr:hypothetical protein CBR_g915 [Chara braunii]|eukprot:GBG67791.1 hypothetical protein CBR_g915 [Chara braunii]